MLPFGTMGLGTLPNEETVLEVLRTSVPEPGLYFFPGMDPLDTSQEAQEAYAAKYGSGPAGLLVYRPIGGGHQEINEEKNTDGQIGRLQNRDRIG